MKLNVYTKSGKGSITTVAILTIAVLAALLLFTGGPTEIKITILQTNDLHGLMVRMPAYASIIKEVRRQEKNVLLLDGGDFFYRGEQENQGGQAELTIMNAMGYNALVLGNTDFNIREDDTAKKSNEQIKAISENANFPILCGNVRYKATGERLDGVKEYVILNRSGFKIALVGVTSMDAADEDEAKDKYFIEPAVYLEQAKQELAGKADCIIVLAHTGLKEAKNFTGITAVVCAHDHEITSVPEQTADGAPIIEAGGEEQSRLGRLDLSFKKENGKWNLTAKSGQVYDSIGIIPDKKIQRLVNGLD